MTFDFTASGVLLLYLFIYFPLPLNIQESARIQDVSKIHTVKEEMERAKYSILIICPLINYICLG